MNDLIILNGRKGVVSYFLVWNLESSIKSSSLIEVQELNPQKYDEKV